METVSSFFRVLFLRHSIKNCHIIKKDILHPLKYPFFSFSTPYNDWRLGLDQMKKGKYVKVSKWINDIKGYFPYIKALRNKLFRFRKHDVWNAKKIMAKLNPENYTMVSIHVRLTDYKEHLYKLYHFKKYVQTDYFKNAMDYFATKYTVSV